MTKQPPMPLESSLDALYLRPEADFGPPLAASQQACQQVLDLAQSGRLYAYARLEWRGLPVLWLLTGPRGLLAIRMADLSEADFLAEAQARLGQRPVRDESLTGPLAAQVLDYLNGERAAFDLPIDWSALPDFQRQVLQAAMNIPRGQVATYGQVAARLGKPKAARAVGRALGTNPLPIVIPCHRVVGSDGQLTGYIGGLAAKAQLLRLEGLQVQGERVAV